MDHPQPRKVLILGVLAVCALLPTVSGEECGEDDYCRILFGWRPGQCMPGIPDGGSTGAGLAAANARFHVGPEFALLPRVKTVPADKSCLLHASGSWSTPIDKDALRKAAAFFEKQPQTNCTLDDLETLSSLRWFIETNADSLQHPPDDNDGILQPQAVHAAQLQHTHCVLARMTDPFDVLAHLWAASSAAASRRGERTSRHPRIDLVGDDSHRALFFRLVSFMRRQPVSLDAAPEKAVWLRYVVTTAGDALDVHLRNTVNRTAPTYEAPSGADVLLELNLWAMADDSDARSAPDMEHAATAVFDGVKSGSLLLGVFGVAYTPDESCAIENAPFAKALLATYRRLHESIDDAMTLDDAGHVVAAGAGATIVSKAAHVPDVLRSDLVVKRNAYARYFMARHRRPIHTVYVEPDATTVPRMEHTLRRLGYLDVHQFVAPFLHEELGAVSYGRPPRTSFGCAVTRDGSVRVAGRCRGWMDLAALQLLLNYVLAENPQW
uniref:Uncharacterized protein n=1 Tax=Neobodo designis TaxID=312471 RepID=A0A6U4VDH4_NEODS